MKQKEISNKDIKEIKIKARQAAVQTDAFEMDNWIPSDGVTMTGSIDSLDPDVSGTGMTYSFGDLDLQTSDMFEEDLRKKYPALKDAYDHYQNIKQMCETREKEENEN